jgi:GxxExxY protein
MDADKNRLELDELTSKIIACVYTVSNTLGAGFLEKVYENALAFELNIAGLIANQQHAINVNYKNTSVGEYAADIFVNNQVILELKAISGLDNNHQAQCMNYLKATNLQVCLLINFGKPKVEIKRIVNNF